MAELRFTFEFEGAEKVERVFLGLSQDVSDMREPYEGIADDLEKVIWPQIFESENSGAWAYRPEERRYVAIKKKILQTNQTPPVLRWTSTRSREPQPGERLYPSFVEKNHPDHVRRITKTGLSVGSDLDYARSHNQGEGTAPVWAGGYPLPRRELIKLESADIRRWDKIIQTYLVKIGAVAGRAS